MKIFNKQAEKIQLGKIKIALADLEKQELERGFTIANAIGMDEAITRFLQSFGFFGSRFKINRDFTILNKTEIEITFYKI